MPQFQGEYKITPKKHVLRFDAMDKENPLKLDEEHAVKTMYIKTEDIKEYVGTKPTAKITVIVE